MKDDKPGASEEFAMLGRGVLRTFIRDVLAVALGAGIGALLGLICVYVFGLSFGAVKIGALIGAFGALVARSHLSRLFEYDRRPPE